MPDLKAKYAKEIDSLYKSNSVVQGEQDLGITHFFYLETLVLACSCIGSLPRQAIAA